MERLINKTHIIDNIELVEERLNEIIGKRIDLEAMMNFIQIQSKTRFYFDSVLSLREEFDKDTQYSWIDTGYRVDEKPIFISLKKYGEEFTGYYVGTADFLAKGLANRNAYLGNTYINNAKKFSKKYIDLISGREVGFLDLFLTENIENKEEMVVEETFIGKKLAALKLDLPVEAPEVSERNKEGILLVEKRELQTSMTDVTEEIFNNLLFPNWRSIDGLDRYIKIVGHRTAQLIDQGRSEYYVMNKTKYVVVNSGLMNLYGQDYLICYRYNEKYKSYIAHRVMTRKQDYLKCGFTKEQALKELKPVRFVDENDELFNPSKEDVDISSECLEHIIDERRDRLPENIRNEAASKIAELLINALDRGIRMQNRDHSYAKASFSTKSGTVSWLMPWHVNTKLTEEPELVIAIRKEEYFYEVKTILPYNDDVKDRIMALALYSNLW